MFKYEDWFDFSDNTEYIESIKNQELYNAVAEKVVSGADIPMYTPGMARIYDGIPIPTLVPTSGSDISIPVIEEVIESIYDFTGFVSCVVVINDVDEGRITYNGSAYIVQLLGSFAEGFPTLGDALEWVDSMTW